MVESSREVWIVVQVPIIEKVMLVKREKEEGDRGRRRNMGGDIGKLEEVKILREGEKSRR